MKLTRKFVTLMLVIILALGTFIVPASAAENQMYGIGFVNASSLRLRSEANTSSAIVATAFAKECVVVLNKVGQWYKVNYNLQEGYMHEDYLKVATKENAELGYGEIRRSGVNLRSGPSTSHSVVAVSTVGAKCYILGLNDGWYKVIYNDRTCYVRSDFVTLTEIPYENKASSNSPKYYRTGKCIESGSAATVTANTSVSGSTILAEARKYLGAPYRAGGATPSGFDCSGFVYYVLKQTGLPANRTPAAQFSQGYEISRSQLQAGDLVFFQGTGASGISHVGIYAGNGQFIHAPNSRSTVSYSSLTSGYWAEHYYSARRVCQ